MGRIALATVALLASQPAADTLETGRAIYEQGVGRDPLSATMGEPGWAIGADARACASCHGAAGSGASEGGIAAPALDLSAMPDRRATDWLGAALRQGRGSGGRRLLAAMPRYALSDRDLAALAGYVRTFPYPPQRGLSASGLAIGLDLDGSGFTEAERDTLRRRFADKLARMSEEGGLFGREPALAATPADAFLTVSWTGLADLPSLAIVARRPGASACASCCASLHAGLEAQLDWLVQRLEARGATVAHRGPLAKSIAPSRTARRGDATIFLGDPADLGTMPAGPLYLFADLGMPAPPFDRRPETFVVAAVDLRARLAAVDALIATEPALASAPRLASAAVELDIALGHILDAAGAEGRRLTRFGVCKRLRETVPAGHAFSIIDFASGLAATRSLDFEPAN